MPERAVFDTNIWISGLIWRGKPYQCLLLARAKLIELIYCQPMAAELSEKLRGVFGYSENDIRAVMYEYRRVSSRVEISGDLHVVTEDPDDDKFVECAVTGGATVVVSGDKHLLELGEYKGISFLKAAEFLERFSSSAPTP